MNLCLSYVQCSLQILCGVCDLGSKAKGYTITMVQDAGQLTTNNAFNMHKILSLEVQVAIILSPGKAQCLIYDLLSNLYERCKEEVQSVSKGSAYHMHHFFYIVV